ncbi:MAG: metallophosphoesterase [Planctomycetia bacterium]|nr:metallophosphoesterase [Planctomycetia bacterium]
MRLPTRHDYPIVAVGDLHGQRSELARLVGRLETLDEWPDCAIVFLGDFVDRGPDVPGTIDLVLELLGRPAGGSAVMGNHDLALVRAARLDDGPSSPYWTDRYRTVYEANSTFTGYLGRTATHLGDAWVADLEALRKALPEAHRDFLTSLPWVVESPGHLFLHCGLSRELGAGPEEQVDALRQRCWDPSRMRPTAGTATDALWEPEYPVWLGADRSLSRSPLPYPGKVQVTGHERVPEPEANPVRIRLDTSGGRGELTACLLRSADASPQFFGNRSSPSSPSPAGP